MKAFVLGVVLAVVGCGDNTPASSGGHVDGGSDGPPGQANLTTFVIDLIQNHTDDHAQPVAFDEFSMLPDPDLNDADPKTGGYAPLFP